MIKRFVKICRNFNYQSKEIKYSLDEIYLIVLCNPRTSFKLNIMNLCFRNLTF